MKGLKFFWFTKRRTPSFSPRTSYSVPRTSYSVPRTSYPVLRTLYYVLSTLFFVLFTTPITAQTEFNTDATVTYKVLDSGKTEVTHEIILENNLSNIYATTYTLSLENIDADKIRAASFAGEEYSLSIDKIGQSTSVKITFSDAVVGRGSKRHFFITYENSEYAVRTGEVWEVSIPRLAGGDSFRSYSVRLLIPEGLGLEAYISPLPRSAQTDDYGKIYTFSKEDIVTTGINAGFGQFQVFSFNLSYHLENPLSTASETQIALPPDTAFQKVYFSKISPAPDNVIIDPDGNYLAIYKLSPRQRIDVNAAGSVQIFASHRKFPRPDDTVLSDNLKESEYWQVEDPAIQALASELKTPQAIYDYVSRTLSYDFSRVTPNVQRLGAKTALNNPLSAICMEFTDLFIAIARAAGIPAREVNGYAYTENPELQPLSLVADVLHSWPEYYDKDKGVWIPIDPTWASTSGGVDYFNKLDLRHFTFVVHGQSATKPYPPGSYKLGPNPQKDVFVSFGKLPEDRISHPQLSVVSKRTTPFLDWLYRVRITNPGPSSLYSFNTTVFFDDKENSSNLTEVLPPYSHYEMDIRVPFSLLGTNTPDKIKVVVESAQIEILTNKSQVIINSLVSIFAIFVFIIFAVLVRLKKITINRLSDKIRSLYEKITGKPKKDSPTGL